MICIGHERVSSDCPLEFYRSCRSLLSRLRNNASSDLALEFEKKILHPFAKTYQPSIAALAVAARILKKPYPPIHAQIFSSGIDMLQ